MRLGNTIGKLAKTPIYGYNPTTKVWDALTFNVLLESSGRWLAGKIAFYNRRDILSPQPIPDIYQVVKLGSDPTMRLVYAGQPNLQGSGTYLHEYTLLDALETIQVVTMVTALTAAGIPGNAVRTVSADSYPAQLERFASVTDNVADSQSQTKMTVYLPQYAGVTVDDELQTSTDTFEILEALDELRLTRLTVIKR